MKRETDFSKLVLILLVFVFTTRGLTDLTLTAYGTAQVGEVGDYHILLVEDGPNVPDAGEQFHFNWSQPPIEIDLNIGEPSVFCGWNEPARSTERTGQKRQWRMDADDFRCIGAMPMTRIRWWGGYKAWTQSEPPQLRPTAWHIGIWANQIEGMNQEETFLERLVWSLEIPAERISFEPIGFNEFPESNKQMLFVYEVGLEPEEWFHAADYESNEDIFWISITAVYPKDVEQQNMWGWTTRPHIWGRGAVMPAIMGDWPSYDERLFPGRIYPIENSLICGQSQAYDMCFELLTEPQWVKWDQPFTGIRQWHGYAGNESMALESEAGELFMLQQVTDDWFCENQVPITAVVWNGSYIGYGYEACKCEGTREPLKPDYFLLSIWSNVSGSDAEPDNHLGEKIWEYKAYDYDEVMVGYDQNPESEPNEAVFRYSVKLPEEAWFRQETPESIYWFSIVAVYRETIDMIPYSWGWTNHSHMFGSTALSQSLANEGPIQEPIYDQTGELVDMSFTLFAVLEQ